MQCYADGFVMVFWYVTIVKDFIISFILSMLKLSIDDSIFITIPLVDLETKIVVFREALFHKVTIVRKKLSELTLLFIKDTWTECESFATVNMVWWDLAVKVQASGTEEYN